MKAEYNELVALWKDKKITVEQLNDGIAAINKKNCIKNKLVVTGWIKGGKIVEYRRVV